MVPRPDRDRHAVRDAASWFCSSKQYEGLRGKKPLPGTAEAEDRFFQHAIIGFFAGGFLLFMKRLKTKTLVVRQQMKWISYGTLAGILPFSVLYILPVLLGVKANFAMESSMLFLAFIPLSIGYALFV